MRQDNNSLAHTTWNCKYHIVFRTQISTSDNLWEIQSKYWSNLTVIM